MFLVYIVGRVERSETRQGRNVSGFATLYPTYNAIDHIVPRSRGGTNHPDNLQLLCQACNSTKGADTQSELIAKLKATGVIGMPV